MAYLLVDKCCDVIDILPAHVMSWINIRANGGNSDMDHRVTAIAGKFEGETRATLNGMGGKPDRNKNRDGKDDKTGQNVNKTNAND